MALADSFVSMASSADQDYPPSNILDPSDSIFWMTTGLYPQEFIVTFNNPIEFRKLRFATNNVKRFVMFATNNQEPRKFETILEKTLPNNENNLQIVDHTFDRAVDCRHLKCVILAGYDSFCSIHSIMANIMEVIKHDLFITIPENGDERVKDWPLMQSVAPTVYIIIGYVLFIIFGRQWMKNRQAFELREFMFVYNFLQVAFCTYITYEAAYVWINESYSFICQPIDFSRSMNAMIACRACWWFYIMKLVDLIDTVLFVLRKKNNQITFLHVYHHITMTFCGWSGSKYVGGGQSLFVIIINSFIHVLMYGYYGLSACGPRIQKFLWWKRYITQAQMLQFIAVIFHSIINLHRQCNYPKIFDVSFLLYGITILMLFSNFYLQSYTKKAKTHNKKA